MRLGKISERILFLILRLLQFETSSLELGTAPDVFPDSSPEAALLQLIHLDKAALCENNVMVRYHLLQTLIFYFHPFPNPIRYHSSKPKRFAQRLPN
jgi:hypothetical protein